MGGKRERLKREGLNMAKVRTVRDAAIAGRLAERFPDTLGAPGEVYQAHESIGQLCRDGVTVCYAYVGGVYREGSAEHLRVLLASERGFISARSAAPLAAAAGLVLAFYGFIVALGIACDSGLVK